MNPDNAKPRSRGDRAPKLEDVLPMLKIPNKWITIRLMPNVVLPIKQHWIDILAGKDKRAVRIPKMCVSFDPETEQPRKGIKCPYCELGDHADDSPIYIMEAISRKAQASMPDRIRPTSAERKSGFKDPNSDTPTPIQPIRIPPSLMRDIMALKELNTRKGTGFHVWHEKYGADISIQLKEEGKKKTYQVQIGRPTPLTEDELAYLRFKLDAELLVTLGQETEKAARAEVKRMNIVDESEFEEDDDDDDDDNLGRKRKAPAKGRGKKVVDADDEDDEDDDDEDEASSRSSKSKSKSNRRDDDDEDEDDEDDDEDEDDDDEDDEPMRRRKPASKSKSKPKRRDDDDDDDDADDDEDEDDEDDDEDEAPRRSSKSKAKSKPASKSKSKSSRRDDDDEDEDDDENDEDDEPVSRRKPASKSKSKRRDDEDDDEDEDDDDEDEAPRRSSKSKSRPAAKKPASKSKSKRRDDDDDGYDDDIPF